MLLLFRIIFYGEFHVCRKWEPDGDRIALHGNPDEPGMPTEIHQPMKCVKCGRRKSFKL